MNWIIVDMRSICKMPVCRPQGIITLSSWRKFFWCSFFMWRFSCHFSVFFCHTDLTDAELCDTNWTARFWVIDIAQRWSDQLSTLSYSEWGPDTPQNWHKNLIEIWNLCHFYMIFISEKFHMSKIKRIISHLYRLAFEIFTMCTFSSFHTLAF